MIISHQNFKTIAEKFIAVVDNFKHNEFPHYISIWSEEKVEAIREIVDGYLSYIIIIDGEELAHSIIPSYNEATIIKYLLEGAEKYIQAGIERELDSIILVVNDDKFTTSLFTAGMSGSVYFVETKKGKLKFIDIRLHNELIYSSLYVEGRRQLLTSTIRDCLYKAYSNGKLDLQIP